MLALMGHRVLRQTWPAAGRLVSHRSTVRKMSKVTTEHAANGVAIVRLSSAPVNVLTRQVMQDLVTSLRAAAADTTVKSVVLTSANPVFSAGLDISEMAGKDTASLMSYIGQVHDVFLTLYPFPKPVIAAINGSAPAGGCWLALLSDVRLMVDAPKAVIGLNETQLGIVAPPYFSEPLAVTVGRRQAERMLQLGALLPSGEALRLGLVDELHPSDKLLPAALEHAAKWSAVPDQARHATKMALRGKLVADLTQDRAMYAEQFVEWVSQPSVLTIVTKYLQSLNKKK